VYPTRVQIGSDPKNLRAIDIFIYPDHLIAIDAWDTAAAEKQRETDPTVPPPAPILHFTREEYPTHLDRLLELAETQRVEKNDDQQISLLGSFLKGQ
jgi:hypothetical protein